MRKLLSGTALWVCLLTASLPGQNASPPREPGRILPWTVNRSARIIADYRAAPADMTAMEANLLKVVDILKATRLLSPPVGYDVRFTGTLNPPDPSISKKVTAISYTLDFAFLDYLHSPSNPAFRTPFANQGLSFHINDPYRVLRASGFRDPNFPRKSWSDQEGELWIEPTFEDFKGLRFYRVYDMLAITKGGAPMWKPVRTERFLGKYLDEKRKDAVQAEARLANAKRSYEAATSAETQARRQKEIEAARARKNGEAEARRLEEMHRQLVDTARAEASPSRTNPNHMWYFGPKQALADAEAMAASLTASARNAQACVTGYENNARGWEFKLVPGGTAGCRRIVEADLGLFDNTLPRSAMQVIVVANLALCEQILKGPNETERTWPGGCRGTVEITRQLDWQKLAALLGK